MIQLSSNLNMNAEDLINHNSLSDVVIDKEQQIVFVDIAITAIKMARIEEKEKAALVFCEQYNKDVALCKFSRKIDYSCRDNCPAYNEFCNLLQ